MTELRRLASRVRRRVRDATDRVRGPGAAPLVTVVVVARGSATGLSDCISSVVGAGHRPVEVLVVPLDEQAESAAHAAATGRHVRTVSRGGTGVDGAVALARGDYLTFVDADDLLHRGGLPRLVASLESSGSDVAMGPVHRVVGGVAHPPKWHDSVFGAPAHRTSVAACPDLLVAATLPGNLVRVASWREYGLTVGPWGRREAAAVRMLVAARTVDVVPGRAYDAVARDVSRPIDEQARFRPADVAERVAAIRAAAGLLSVQDEEVHRRWPVLTLTHVVPPMLVDAVGGGPRVLELLAPLVRDLVQDTGPGALAEVPVAARLLARASQGSLHDVALVQDLLADNPDGLPTERSADGARVVRLPAGLGLPVPDASRRIEPVDRVLRTVVGPLRRTDGGGLLVEGAAFVEYGERAALPSVTLSSPDGLSAPMTVEPRHDPAVNLWARRAWEDRSSAGFTAVLDPAAVPPSPESRWRIDVHLGRSTGSHEGRLVDDGQPLAARFVGAQMEADTLVLTGSGAAPDTVRLAGAKGDTAAAPVSAAPVPSGAGNWSVRVTLRTDLFDESVLLPAGRYEVDVRDRSGDAVPLSWQLPPEQAELLSDRLRLVPGTHPDAAALTVAAPLRIDERSAYDQQRLQSHVYAAPAAASYDTTVVLETFRGRSVGDSPGAIGRELQQRDLGLELAWVVDDPSVQVPEGTHALPRRSERWYDTLANGRVYIGNAGAPYWFEKKPGQVHLQTWHGTPLKRIGEDRGPGDFQTWRHRRRIAMQAAGWDAMISPSPFCSKVFRSAFRFDGRFLEVGYPRNDLLVGGRAAEVRDAVRARLGLAPDDTAVLYAPTWREYVGVRDAKPLYLDAEALVAAVPEAVVLVRGHYNSSHQPDVFAGERRIRDVTRYPDIADLFVAADVLVTDYSSVMFDFALTDKPQVLLVPDLEQYRDVERGFYLDFEEIAPGPLVDTTDEVAAALRGDDTHAAARAACRERFCPWDDGRAAARTVDWLLAQI